MADQSGVIGKWLLKYLPRRLPFPGVLPICFPFNPLTWYDTKDQEGYLPLRLPRSTLSTIAPKGALEDISERGVAVGRIEIGMAGASAYVDTRFVLCD